MSQQVDEIVRTVQTWAEQRQALSTRHGFTQRSLREFVEAMNGLSRKLIRLTGNENPDFWSGLSELATNCMTMTQPGAKLMVDHQDMTDAH